MIKNSSILKWTHNNRNHHSKGVVREWLHPPDALQRGHIAYLVKFLGNTEVDQAKGIDVVKEGIRKLKFTSQLRKSEGAKTPKVELTISIDGVAIQEPKTKRILHQYPLHRISYCADDKAEKKFFSFIAKEADSDKHVCFVFVSDKLAEEITLTIGQAFDLAYRRFLESSGRDLEMRKQLMILQKKIQDLETENDDLKRRIGDLQMLKDRQDVDSYKLDHGIADLCVVNGGSKLSDNEFSDDLSKPSAAPAALSSPIYTVPSRKSPKEEVKTPLSPSQELFMELGPTLPTVGTKLENLDLDDFEDFNPRGTPTTTNGNVNSRRAPLNADSKPGSAAIFEPAPVPLLQPPRTPTTPTICLSNGSHSGVTPPPLPLPRGKDLFGAEPFVPRTSVAATAAGVVADTPTLNDANDGSSGDQEDPFGMGDFGEVPTHLGAQELESAIGDLDKRLSEMRDGFSRGISFGNEDFSLESLDPLNNKQAMA